MIGASFRLTVLQFAPALLEAESNARRIAAAADESGADLVVAPELALTGYDLRDAAADVALGLHAGAELPALAATPDLIVGLVEATRSGLVFNAAAHVRRGAVLFRHRKLYLPTYGMFDEARWFAAGRALSDYEPGGPWRFGLLICEDLWHPALAYVLATRGIDLLIVLAAAPGRGVRNGRFASADAWERLVRTTAEVYGVYVVLANRVGVEGGLVFAGGSLIVAPTGDVLARAPDAEEAVIEAPLSIDEVQRARRHHAHLRDDDPHLTLRELGRVLGSR